MLIKKFNILFILISVILLISADLQAASIRIARNDVDSSRADFITAGYTFSFDILLDSLDNFNGASFELNWDRPDYIFFSEWQIGKIGEKSQAFVEKYPGKLIVAVSTGLPLIESHFANSSIISLKFVVLQNAMNLDSVKFTFQKPTASATIDTQPQLLPLEHLPFVFKIHSYIEVFPGDADGNGIVDHLDYSNVMLNLGLGSESQHSRTFKRLYPSIFWVPQKVLVWDLPDATYADCDGNGEITMKDMLVVSYNLGKTTNQIGKVQTPAQSNSPIIKSTYKVNSENNIILPINFQTDRKFLSAYIKIQLTDNLINNLSDTFIHSIFNENNEISFSKIVGNYLYIFLGTSDRSMNLINSGEIARLIFNENGEVSANGISSIEGEAIDESGNIFPIDFQISQQRTSIADITDDNLFNINVQSNSLEISAPINTNIQSVEIYDILGRLIASQENIPNPNSIIINLPNSKTQILFVAISTNQGKRICKIQAH
jgi:hypothetical protein